MYIKLFLISLPTFFVIDMVWIGLVAKSFYKQQIGFLLADKANWPAAISFYLIFLAGLTYFVIAPAIDKNSWTQALVAGAFFGLVTYATYDLTNQALTKNWPLTDTLVDMAWGVVLAASVSTVTYLVGSHFGV